MTEPDLDRITDVESTIQSGFRYHARGERRTQSVQLADNLAEIYDQLDETQLPIVDETMIQGHSFLVLIGTSSGHGKLLKSLKIA